MDTKMKIKFCKKCHKRLEAPILNGNVKIEGELKVVCGYCKQENKIN